ncbi:MAG: hypothetical protein AAGB31_06815 [Bdellovibrio sp.]
MRNSVSLYQVPGWSGFDDSEQTLISKRGVYILEPSGFMRIHQNASADLISANRDSNIVLYRILKNGTDFKIQNPEDSVMGIWKENFILMINLSTNQTFEVRIP